MTVSKDNAVSSKVSSSTKSSGGSKMIMIVALALVVLIPLLGIGGFIVYDKVIKDDESKDESKKDDSSDDSSKDDTNNDASDEEKGNGDLSDDETDFLKDAAEKMAKQEGLTAIMSSSKSGEGVMQADLKNNLFYITGTFGGSDLEMYADATTTYLKFSLGEDLGGDQWYKFTADSSSGIGDIASIFDDIKNAKDSDVASKYTFVGEMKCPNNSSRTCLAYKGATSDDNSVNYFDKKDKLLVYVEQEVDGDNTTVEITYKKVSITIPDEAKNAQSYEDAFNNSDSTY